MVCGRTIRPFPHTHSTSRLSLHVGKEANNRILPFLHSSIHMQRRSLPSPDAQAGILHYSPQAKVGILHYFPLAASWGAIFFHPQFPCEGAIHDFYCGGVFPCQFCGLCICFSLPRMRAWSPLLFWAVYFSLFQCWDRGYCFPHDLWFDVGSFSFWFSMAIIEMFWPR